MRSTEKKSFTKNFTAATSCENPIFLSVYQLVKSVVYFQGICNDQDVRRQETPE
jgi:hypothetical protein